MLRSYLPAIVFLVLGGAVGGAFAVLNTVLGPRRVAKHKQDPYECGLPSEVKQGMRFGISFYLIAMLFILFDIEVIFLYPIAVDLRADQRSIVPADIAEGLKKLGHQTTSVVSPLGGGQAIWIDWDKGTLTGGSDPRKDGCALGY